MRRPAWWGVGLAAAAIAYGVMAVGLAWARSWSDPYYCGLPGLEMLVVLGTLVVHPWIGFVAGTALTRPGRRRVGAALLAGLAAAFGAVLADLWGIGPAVFPTVGGCEDEEIRWLPGLLVTGVSAALYARAGTSARNPSISSATRSGRSSGRK